MDNPQDHSSDRIAPDDAMQALACGCRITPGRDRFGRGVGTINARGAACAREDHLPGRVVLLPGRQHARPE